MSETLPGAPPDPRRAEERPPAEADGEGWREGEAGEVELWRRWRGQHDEAARAELVARHEGYAKSIAARLYSRRPSHEVPFDDYHQLARLGLLEAISRYDPDRGAQFRTFATRRIEGSILNGLETQTERHQQLAMRRRLGAERTSSFVPEHMELGDGDRLLSQLGDLAVSIAVAMILDGLGLGGEGREGLPRDAYAETELKQMRARLWEGVERLPERERRILMLHYRQGVPFEEIAGREGVTKGRISQLHKQAVESVRAMVLGTDGCDLVL